MRTRISALLAILVIPLASAFGQEATAPDNLTVVEPALAATVCAGKVIPIDSIAGGGVLYKPANLHGGRGPSFLVQNVAERTGKHVIEIRNARCEVIGTLGLFATDQPYGARYYSKSGGTGLEDTELLALASKVGSTNILIEGVDKWIRVKNPTLREGSVRK